MVRGRYGIFFLCAGAPESTDNLKGNNIKKEERKKKQMETQKYIDKNKKGW